MINEGLILCSTLSLHPSANGLSRLTSLPVEIGYTLPNEGGSGEGDARAVGHEYGRVLSKVEHWWGLRLTGARVRCF